MSSRQLESSAQLQRDLAAMWAAPVDIVDPRRQDAAAPSGRPLHTFAVLPSNRRPRIVATDSRAALAGTVRRYSHSTGTAGRLARIALATAIRMGAHKLVCRDRLAVVAIGEPHGDGDDSLITRLAEIFDTEVSIGLSVGAVRANRKPVLQVLTPDGRTLGFAKLGTSPLARSLLDAEAENLRLLAQRNLQRLELPQVLHHGVWHEHELLVMTALSAPLLRRHPLRALPVQAMTELAECEGTWTSSLADSAWFGDVVAATAETPDSSADRFQSLLDRLGRLHGDDPVRFGSWHGDWGPWNMVWAGDRVRLWDWERFARGVPYGLDALYYAMPLPQPKVDLSQLRESTLKALASFSLGRHEADLLLPLYVTALCARFLPDSLTEHGQQLRPRVATLLDLLEGTLADRAPRQRPTTRSSARPEEVRR